MKYISTRGKAPVLDFEGAVLAGLASDGGLYVPGEFPQFSPGEIAAMAGMSYEELTFTICKPFIDGCIPDNELKEIINESYAGFSHKAIAPLKHIGNQEFLLELFHGPTIAFKDFALQMLGRLFDNILKKRNECVTIIGATSGDTGSAAIEGCRHSKHVKMFIMHPHNRISEVQRRQMTTVLADNVHNLAVEDSFDFCQDAVKAMFSDQSFLKNKSRLIAINSINWGRIMVQIVYYFYAAVHLGAPARGISFSVPTGNFGDVFAGYIAYKMGLPVKQLIIATNKNDILHKFITGNKYAKGQLVQTLSPSMDIQVASNFERLLFDLYDNDGKAIDDLMVQFKTGSISIDRHRFDKAHKIFDSASVDDDLTCDTIKHVYKETGEIIDPHSATGVCAARLRRKFFGTPMVILATAHPAKFPDAIEKAGINKPSLPPHLSNLLERKERFEVVSNNIEEIKQYISNNC